MILQHQVIVIQYIFIVEILMLLEELFHQVMEVYLA